MNAYTIRRSFNTATSIPNGDGTVTLASSIDTEIHHVPATDAEEALDLVTRQLAEAQLDAVFSLTDETDGEEGDFSDDDEDDGEYETAIEIAMDDMPGFFEVFAGEHQAIPEDLQPEHTDGDPVSIQPDRILRMNRLG